MPYINSIPAPSSYHHDSLIDTIAEVCFENGMLSELELVHARATAKTNFPQLCRIAERMNGKSITYREAFLELHNEGNL